MTVTAIAQVQTEQKVLSYHQFNKAVLTFALKTILSNKIPHYIISVGPDSMGIGNALSRLFGKTVGVLMSDPETGHLAEKVSIVNQVLKGRGLLVGARNTKDIQNAISRYQGLDNFILEDTFKKKILLPEDNHQISNGIFPHHEEYLDITATEYFQKINSLGLKVNYDPDFIIAIGRGGLIVGKALAKLLNKPLGAWMASSYTENGKCERRDLNIAFDISINDPFAIKGKGLVVDDLADSGVTLQKTAEAIQKNYPEITEIRTATPYQKTCTKIKPDFSIDTVQEGIWIYFHEEIFERIDIIKELSEELAMLPSENLPKLAKAILKSIPSDPRIKLSKDDLLKLISEVQA